MLSKNLLSISKYHETKQRFNKNRSFFHFTCLMPIVILNGYAGTLKVLILRQKKQCLIDKKSNQSTYGYSRINTAPIGLQQILIEGLNRFETILF